MLYYVVQIDRYGNMDGVLTAVQKQYPFLRFITRFDNPRLLIFKYTNKITTTIDSLIDNMHGVRSTAIDDADALTNGYNIFG